MMGHTQVYYLIGGILFMYCAILIVIRSSYRMNRINMNKTSLVCVFFVSSFELNDLIQLLIVYSFIFLCIFFRYPVSLFVTLHFDLTKMLNMIVSICLNKLHINCARPYCTFGHFDCFVSCCFIIFFFFVPKQKQ